MESPKRWNSRGYFCPKNTFLQLKHNIQVIYLRLFWTTFVKTHHIPKCDFGNHKPFFTTQLLFNFLVQTLHTLYKNTPLKCKFSNFPLLALKFTKFLRVFFKQKVSFASKFGSLFSVIRDNFSLLFSWNFICYWQKWHIKVQIFRLATARINSHQILHVFFGTKSQFSFKLCITIQCH